MSRYVLKPIKVEAIQWTGNNYADVCVFLGREALRSDDNSLILYNLIQPYFINIGDYIVRNLDYEYSIFTKSKFLELFDEVN